MGVHYSLPGEDMAFKLLNVLVHVPNNICIDFLLYISILKRFAAILAKGRRFEHNKNALKPFLDVDT